MDVLMVLAVSLIGCLVYGFMGGLTGYSTWKLIEGDTNMYGHQLEWHDSTSVVFGAALWPIAFGVIFAIYTMRSLDGDLRYEREQERLEREHRLEQQRLEREVERAQLAQERDEKMNQILSNLIDDDSDEEVIFDGSRDELEWRQAKDRVIIRRKSKV